MKTDATATQEQIRQLVEARAQAVHTKDLQGATKANAPNILTFDVLPPLRNRGAAGICERTQRWLDGYDGAPGYEIHNLEVVAGEEVAFASYLYHVSGTLTTGGEVNMWVRATLGLQKQGSAWQIVHEHDSVPFDPESGQALISLEP